MCVCVCVCVEREGAVHVCVCISVPVCVSVSACLRVYMSACFASNYTQRFLLTLQFPSDRAQCGWQCASTEVGVAVCRYRGRDGSEQVPG